MPRYNRVLRGLERRAAERGHDFFARLPDILDEMEKETWGECRGWYRHVFVHGKLPEGVELPVEPAPGWPGYVGDEDLPGPEEQG